MPRLLAHAGAAVLLLPGCTAIFGLDEKPLTTSADAGDAGPPCTPDDAGYHNPKTASCWATYYTPTSFDPLPQYTGASFDGRYAYFLNNQYGNVVRIDTTGAFTDMASWKNYSTSELQVNGPNPFSGIVFDGRYMYFIPASPAWFVRYDTTAPFESKSSWTSFQPSPSSDPIYYEGGTFDGRYVYFAPAADANGNDSGLVLRYDTTATFSARASWTTFDLTRAAGDLSQAAMQFQGAVFDGTYVYLVPDGVDGSVVARYYVAGAFNAASSWELFDTGTVSAHADGYVGGMFDGKLVHFIPGYESGVAMTYDPAKPFTDHASWSFHTPDPGAGELNNGSTPAFGAGLFDGRYLYYVPTALPAAASNGAFYRQEAVPTTDAGAWSRVNTTAFGAQDFGAAVFDGRYAYFAPCEGESFARFDARETSVQPALPHYHGSFY